MINGVLKTGEKESEYDMNNTEIRVSHISSEEKTDAEKKIADQGFCLLEQDIIKIDSKISYPIIKYARFLDPGKTDYDMVITFDPSQYSVEVWNRDGNTVFLDPHILTAIQKRIDELEF